MAVRIRFAIVGALVAVAAVALAGTGLGSAAMARLGGHAAGAAVRPAYVDVSDLFRSDPGWGMAQGLIAPEPVAASAVVAAPNRSVSEANPHVVAVGPAPVSGYVPLGYTGPAGSTLRNVNLARAGLQPAPGCSGAACGTDGCGFLAPGCAMLDCSLLNPACGLGIPVDVCGILDPTCGFSGCGFFGSRCRFGFDEEDDVFDRLRFREFRFSDLFRDHHLFDRHFHDRFHESHHH
jgi:hypothetical protein